MSAFTNLCLITIARVINLYVWKTCSANHPESSFNKQKTALHEKHELIVSSLVRFKVTLLNYNNVQATRVGPEPLPIFTPPPRNFPPHKQGTVKQVKVIEINFKCLSIVFFWIQESRIIPHKETYESFRFRALVGRTFLESSIRLSHHRREFEQRRPGRNRRRKRLAPLQDQPR